MKKKNLIITGISALIISATLAGCSPVNGNAQNGEPQSTTGVPEDVYSSLIMLLRDEIADLKSESAKNSTSYEQQIAALESKLAAAESKLADLPSTTVPDTSEPQNQEQTPFTYTVTDGEASITGYNGDYAVIVIPERLGGFPVTSIADNAFSSKTKLTGVTVPEGIVSLGWFAFSGCTSLTSINLPSSVRLIGYDAFAYCTKMKIVCPDGSYAADYADSFGIARVSGN